MLVARAQNIPRFFTQPKVYSRIQKRPLLQSLPVDTSSYPWNISLGYTLILSSYIRLGPRNLFLSSLKLKFSHEFLIPKCVLNIQPFHLRLFVYPKILCPARDWHNILRNSSIRISLPLRNVSSKHCPQNLLLKYHQSVFFFKIRNQVSHLHNLESKFIPYYKLIYKMCK
jgi:hypothetical protein